MQVFNILNLNPEIGGYFHFGNLQLAPVSLSVNQSVNHLSTLDELFDEGLVEVSELHDSGVVNSVRIKNNSKSHLVIFDNDLIKGARQNRVAQTTFVVAPSQETVAPVYCVERNRWGYSGNKNFEKSAQKMGPKARQVKMQMLRSEVSASAVQSSVWDEVDELSDKFASYNNTSDLAQVLAQQDFEEENALRKFLKESECHGFAVVAGQRRFVELFWDEAICKKQVGKSVRSWLADAAMERSSVALSQPSLKSELQNSIWIKAEPIASEQPLDNQNLSGGRITLLENSFLHSYIVI
ncbi:hypothetical protein OA011_00345 [bacterium]|nr:hypothetical protein [bacterium]